MTNQTSPWQPPQELSAMRQWLGECFHPARSKGQADLYSLTGEAANWILKDFSKRPLLVRIFFTRRVAQREARALQAFQDMPGFPRFGGFIGPDAFLLERLHADRLPHLGATHTLDAVFFSKLDQLVRGMHERKWTHGDLRRKNILFDDQHNPYLIDFATAMYCGPGGGLLKRLLFKRLALVDRITIIRIKQSYLPDALTSEDEALLQHEPLYLRAGRFFKKKIYRPLKPRHRKELWAKVKKCFGGK